MTEQQQGRVYVRRRGTTSLPNGTVHDSRLSYPALGLLCVLLARPDGVQGGYRNMMGRGLGETATRRALRELSELGYRHQVRRHGPDGRWVTDTVVSEEPITEAEARAWLVPETVDNPEAHAVDSTARSDQHKHRKPAGGTVQRPTTARSAVARQPTASLRAKETSLRSVSQRSIARDNYPELCVHEHPAGVTAKGLPLCPMCRHAARF